MISGNDTPTFVDTHAHLDDGRFEGDLNAILAAATNVGVRHVVNIGYRPHRWRTSIALAERRHDVSFTLGLHPHHADEFSASLLADLAATIEKHRPVALGEIGLDYFRDLSDRDSQRRAFAAQLDLATQCRLPVVIHMRGEVEEDLRSELDRIGDHLIAVLHSFDGSEELAEYALSRGFFFGVGGLVTRESNARLREIVRNLPMDRLLLETDAPYLTPAGIKDRRNSPVNIPAIAATLASLKSVTLDDVANATTENARRVFGLSVGMEEAKPAESTR
ncbi:MAG: TatD DNase family protein [Thermomicrobiales bacterium]|nr:TatD DNase family protein [Thermomicrobiales bacterium]